MAIINLVPFVSKDKRAFYETLVQAGGEGVVFKDVNAEYVEGPSRTRAMFKAKRFEEFDAFVTGFKPGEEEGGWELLVGALEFSCVTESGQNHPIAFCSNLTLEDRKLATRCGNCRAVLSVNDVNLDGKRRIMGTKCTGCAAENPPPVMNLEWKNRVAEIRGQEFTSRVFRLKHATIERWRVGADGKTPEECVINLAIIKARFERAEANQSIKVEL